MQSLLLRYHDEIVQPVRAQTLSLRPTGLRYCQPHRESTGQTNRDGITSRSLECSMTSQLVADVFLCRLVFVRAFESELWMARR